MQITPAQNLSRETERDMGVTKEQVEASLTSKLNPVHLVTQLILTCNLFIVRTLIDHMRPLFFLMLE